MHLFLFMPPYIKGRGGHSIGMIMPTHNNYLYYTPRKFAGVYSDPYVRPFVRPSVRLSLPISNPLLLLDR